MRVRRRHGLSEVMAAVITIAITVIAGAALFGFINGQAASSENSLGVANAANVNFLNERFVVAQVVYDAYPSTNEMTVYFYNSGQVTDNFASIVVFAGQNGMDILFNSTKVVFLMPSQKGCDVNGGVQSFESTLLGNAPGSFSVPIGKITSITLTLPSCNLGPSGSTIFSQGNTYGVKVIGQYGNSVTSYQEM